MNKICTSIDQSEKLIELGIDVNTADMIWVLANPDLPMIKAIAYEDSDKNNKYYEILPAWSLSVLLELMPFHIIENNVRYEFQIVKGLNKEGGTYKIKYKSYTSLFETLMYNNSIDAAFEMICLLKENGKI